MSKSKAAPMIAYMMGTKKPNKKQPIVGNDRRTGERRLKNLGGPIIEEPKLLYTREEAIGRLVEVGIEVMRDWDDGDRADILINGYDGKPYNHLNNCELAEELQVVEQDIRIKVVKC